jgi:starch synthase
VPIHDRIVEGRILASKLPASDVEVFLIDQPAYFDRDGLYQHEGADYSDNCERFVFFARAALEAIGALGLRPDVLNCNDWQAGLVPVYLRELYRHRPEYAGIATVLTIHNLAYQGVFWHLDMPLTGLDWRLFNHRQLEFHGKINLLKGGLVFADMLNTVSPTYAREIQTPEFGCGLDGLLRSRSDRLTGIVNGIDTAAWNPATDPVLAANYTAETVAAGKPACKAQLQRRADLPERREVPLFAQIGRLDPQKGWDLLAEVADDLLRTDVQLVVLGEGLDVYKDLLNQLAQRYPGRVRAFFGFFPELAHQIEAGADFFLMPSRYEPCGLNQLYSQAYGAVPIVHATGGLVDTVVDVTSETLEDGSATGIAFRPYTGRALAGALGRAIDLWHHPDAMARVIAAGMRADWSWDRSARAYVQLYEEARARHAR